MPPRARAWVFTYNNPTPAETPEDFLELLRSMPNIRYAVFQLEEGETGTRHYQGYMEFNRAMNLGTLRRYKQMHYERRRGSRQQARAYSMKEATRLEGPWEHGNWEAGGQGARTDLIAFKDAVKAGGTKRQMIDDHTLAMAKYPRFYTTIRSTIRPVRVKPLVVRLNYGTTGTGKTRYAFDKYPDLFEIPISNGTMWFDGYDMHENVLFDDFCGARSKVSLDTLLKLLDRYPRMVPVKGEHVWWLPTNIVITTNIHPSKWYDWCGRHNQFLALARRITEVYLYSDAKQDPMLQDSNCFWNLDYDNPFYHNNTDQHLCTYNQYGHDLLTSLGID